MINDTPESLAASYDDEHGEPCVPLATAMKMERERNALAKKFTRLDKPKYSGDSMLDAVLADTNHDFREWVDSLPPTYWARYDLSAARIGWEAACKFIFENDKEHAPLSAAASVDSGTGGKTTDGHENRAADRGCCDSACSTSSVDTWEDEGMREIRFEQKNGVTYLGINVDADLCFILSENKRKELLNLLMSSDDGKLNL